jgi:hypothetical protein
MLIAVPAEHWPPWHSAAPEHLAKWLLQLARLVNLRQVATSKRKPKRAAVKGYVDGATARAHRATARVLAQARIQP